MTNGNTLHQTIPPSSPSKHKAELSDWCVNLLAQCGVTHYFGYPGAAIAPLYDALGRTRTQKDKTEQHIRVLTTKHESTAAHAAEGYFRVTQKIAVCIATAGPGVANTVAGVASAEVERIPMLVITGCPPVKDFARGAFQDVSGASDLDAVSMMDKVCKFSAMATHPLQLPHLLFKALSIAQGESPGPVHICVPLDVFQTPVSSLEQLPTPTAFAQSLPKYSRGLDPHLLQSILTKLLSSNTKDQGQRNTVKKACLVIGGGCINIAQDLLRLAKTLEWDVVGTPCSKGLIAHDHPSFCGVMGLGGHPLAYETLSKPDQIVLIIGTRFDESETGGWSAAQLSFENTIQIDSNPENLFCYMPIATRYLCDLELFAQALEQHLLPHAPLNVSRPATHPVGNRPKYIIERHWELTTAKSSLLDEFIKPQAFVGKLNALAAPQAHVCSDSGSAFMWTTHLWPSMPSTGANPNRFHVAMGFGMMGWSTGSSLGVAQALKSAKDSTPCLCVVGDGAYLMSSHEIGTAKQHNLKIAYFIINNSSLGIVEHCQKILGAEQIAYELPTVRYTAHADAFDLPSFEVLNTEDLEKGWQLFLNQEGPALFDVKVDHSELSPLGFRLQSLGFCEKD